MLLFDFTNQLRSYSFKQHYLIAGYEIYMCMFLAETYHLSSGLLLGNTDIWAGFVPFTINTGALSYTDNDVRPQLLLNEGSVTAVKPGQSYLQKAYIKLPPGAATSSMKLTVTATTFTLCKLIIINIGKLSIIHI